MLIALGVLIVAVLVAGLLGLGPLALLERPRRNAGLLGGTMPAGALTVAAGLAAAALGVGGVVGLGLGGSANEPPSTSSNVAPPEPTSTAPIMPASTVAGAAAETADGDGDVAALGPFVTMSAGELEGTAFPRSDGGVDGLEPDTVLRLTVDGFDEFEHARALQCVTATQTVCRNEIGVQFGAEGSAEFQYLVVDDFAPAAAEERCRAGAAPCSIVVESLDGDQRAEILTLFHDEMPPPGRITVTPTRRLADGQSVLVEVEGYPAGSEVQAMLCAAPAATGTERCGAPGPTAAMTVGPDGRGRARLAIRSGLVGRAGVFCGPDSTCGVSVASATVFARAPVVPVTFAALPGAGYDMTRMAIGLGTAVGLLALGAWLVRRTDWSPIGEAATPEIDDAVYADLDAIIAALPPEEDLEEASSGRRE